MDLDMDEGIELNVAMSLLYGIETKSDEMISATCGYLANRLPELKQIRAIEEGEEITLDLILNKVN